MMAKGVDLQHRALVPIRFPRAILYMEPLWNAKCSRCSSMAFALGRQHSQDFSCCGLVGNDGIRA